MNNSRKCFKSVAVQVETQCERCLGGSPNKTFTAEVAIQTELGTSEDHGTLSGMCNKRFLTTGAQNDVIVTPTQGIIFTNKENSHLLNVDCSVSKFSCSSCCSCKYVNNCATEVPAGINPQKNSCPSLPEPACISLDSSFLDSKCRMSKNNKRKKCRRGFYSKNKKRNRQNCSETSQCEITDIKSLDSLISIDKKIKFDEALGNCESIVESGNDGDSEYEPLPEGYRRMEGLKSSRSLMKNTNSKRTKLPKEGFFRRKLPLEGKNLTKRKVMKKTNYIAAGLYSEEFKSNSNTSANAMDISTSSERIPPIFPMPIHYGKFLMKQQVDFKLSYDIWISKVQTKKKRLPSPIYKKIKNNIYVDAKPVCKDFEPHPCNCKLPINSSEKGCTDNCLNRMVYTECVPSLCACGDQCDNQRIQRHQAFTDLKEFQTDDRGYGVFSTKPICAGQFIMEYVGEVVSEQEFRRRMTSLYSNMKHHYCLSLDGGTVIDGYRCGNISRLINHSCLPNCEMQKWNVNGVPRIGLFALKDVSVNGELTYDYNFHAYNINAQQACKCGSENCRKVVGGRGQKVTDGSGQEKSRTTKVGFTMCHVRKNRSQLLQLYSSIYNGLPIIRERKLIRRKVLFLTRNLRKTRRLAKLEDNQVEKDKEECIKKGNAIKADGFKTQFTAINTCRSVRTRQLTKAEDDDSVLRMSDLAQVFMQIFNSVTNCKDEYGNLASNSLYHLPSKKKFPMLYEMVLDPIDLSTIERNINTGKYSTSISFHDDFMKFFLVAEKVGSDGTSLDLLRSQYFSSMETAGSFLESIGDVLPNDLKFPHPSSPSSMSSSSIVSSPPSTFLPNKSSLLPPSPPTNASFSHHQQPPTFIHTPSSYQSLAFEFQDGFPITDGFRDDDDDDIIRCICGMVVDEGVMLQCEKCHTWQHQFCMAANEDEEYYLCHVCSPRMVSKEVLLPVQPKDGAPGCKYYMTLMRGDLQLRVGDTLYVVDEDDHVLLLRSSLSLFSTCDKTSELLTLEQFSTSQLDETYKNLLRDVDKLDLFRIENLWIDQNGVHLMHGYYYLRPREIYHDVGQKFFEKEVLKAPSLSSTLPLSCAIGPCCVTDVNSYFMGRSKGFDERDVYVCEFKVDKNWRTVKKPHKVSYHVNKAKFCFSKFKEKIHFKRTYTPHNIPQNVTIHRNSNRSVQNEKFKKRPTRNNNTPIKTTASLKEKLQQNGGIGKMKSTSNNVENSVKQQPVKGQQHNDLLKCDVETKRFRLEDIASRLMKEQAKVHIIL